MDKTQYFKTNIGVGIKAIANAVEELSSVMPRIKSKASDEIASYDEDLYFRDLREVFQKQPDLLYGISILVSEGVNKNKDAFLRDILTMIFKTPRNKFVDFEHDAEGYNFKGENPENYQIVGHIYDSQLSTQRLSQRIPDEEVKRDDIDGKWFAKDSEYRDEALDIVVAWVLYKFQFPELADMVSEMTELDPDHFGVSMEVLFTDYKFRIGGTFDPKESFDFDGNTTGATEVRKGDPLADLFQSGWQEGKYRIWNGQPVIRILGGDIFFSGMAITGNRANSRSWNLSIGSSIDKQVAAASASSDEENKLVKLIKSVASKADSFDFEKCEIVDGIPSCDCVEGAIASSVDSVINEISEIEKEIEKSKELLESAEKSKAYIDEDNDFYSFMLRTNEIQNGVIRAQKRLRDLFENNIDSNLSGQEILEFVSEIENTIRRSRVESTVANDDTEVRIASLEETIDKLQSEISKIEGSIIKPRPFNDETMSLLSKKYSGE